MGKCVFAGSCGGGHCREGNQNLEIKIRFPGIHNLTNYYGSITNLKTEKLSCGPMDQMCFPNLSSLKPYLMMAPQKLLLTWQSVRCFGVELPDLEPTAIFWLILFQVVPE